jgi:hypothetical protein
VSYLHRHEPESVPEPPGREEPLEVAGPDHDLSCDDCDWTGTDDDLNAVRKLTQRVEAGDPMPLGECPNCGALISGPTPAWSAARQALLDMHKMLYPERYEPFDHVYWNNGAVEPAFQWPSDAIEWIADALQRALADHPDARLTP